ncbi:MAG: carbohydrate kinase [Chitinophagaceae bacterium]|nr:carbohydrate kinase [Chitinophagaceae bacterium]
MDFQQLFQDFTQIRVAVLGDVMLDTYWWGQVDRISPEAPVPVVALNKKEYRIGGAGNVALNTASLGAQTTMISVIGDDADGAMLTNMLREAGIGVQTMLSTADRITTNKIRIIGRNQQMMRLDAEHTNDIDTALEDQLLKLVAQHLQEVQPHVLILEDYNKGVLTARVIAETIALCKQYGVSTAVDPKKKNFLSYQGVDIFKPNLKEVKEGLNLSISQVNLDSLNIVHQALNDALQHRYSFITLSEKGVFYQGEQQQALIPSHVRNIADVSGAGDTVIATASLVYAATKGNMDLAAKMANIAGGLVCEEVGTMAINRDKLLHECNLLLA